MPRRARLDAELVRRGLARSRDHASQLIADGRVTVHGTVATKPATGVETGAALVVREVVDDPNWASRGAHKLIGALDAFDLSPDGKRCLDAGASTGGFTDVLLRRGARQVVAVDVGRGQLVWRLQTDDRVVIMDKTNAREITPEGIGGAADMVVSDLSFISLRLVLPALAACATDEADVIPMIKPQFEVGKERLGAGGVVRDPADRADAVRNVLRAAGEAGLRVHGVAASPLPGPAGNVEYFAWLRRGEPLAAEVAAELVETAVREGPQ
ncbi:TlyA family RNA methyltransferase [Actinokineospora spheciospongiae]|uniref:TlyA family RNA methyltransferase n=1 Tax=Actinokineospora spheciospongiae TaxID=909613 RepID=UPI000D71687E|nr:TlyA family RNA methyltransferase [Actinokineospora spheciospongiae]PWW59368.1 23S rRNA (cytidine1920-2'-O)/16S rRNA (cytidine1409-2'-O)-methyltransferase [Actinokineospora spheciospongiae]